MPNRIWRLFDRGNTKRLGTVNNRSARKAMQCPLYPDEHQRSVRGFGELSVELPERALADDISWTWESDCLVSRSFAFLLRSSNITGFDTRPVEITIGGIAIEHQTEQLVVVGWGGIAKPESGVRLDESESCSACGHLVYSGVQHWRHLIDVRHWDGSDIFMVWPLPTFILVTDRVAKLLKDNKTRELTLTPLDAMEPQEGDLSPGRVGYWLPSDKIRSMAIPNDIA
jgi:hypothetical protein